MLKEMLKRNELITLFPLEDNTYLITNIQNETITDKDDNFYIYLANVNLKQNGIIQGRFMGYTDNSIIDDYCKPVKFIYDVGWYTEDGQQVRTVRMLAVDNKCKTVIIIENN